jgi:Flp pilus assembly pilin Flp
MSILSHLVHLSKDENGTTILEYGLILATVSMGIIAAAAQLTNGSGGLWSIATNALTGS